MRIAVVCGGTGGHVLPGLATARVLVERGHSVTLWLGGREVESMSAGDWDGPVERVRAAGFDAGLSLRSASSALRLVGACAASHKRMRAARPDVVLAMGSYASVGPVVAARLLRIPVVLHEANAVPGRAVSLLSRFAAAIAVTFDSARRYLAGAPVVPTGLPLRDGLPSADSLDGIAGNRFTILVMGGSQGARALNERVPAALAELRRRGADFTVIHLAGVKDEAAVRRKYEEAEVDSRVYGFLGDIGRAYASASLAICRAGAGTCAELAVCGVPALLVPLPAARRGHQLANARELEAAGGADVLPQKDLDEARLVHYMEEIMADPDRLKRMQDAMKSAAGRDAAPKLADLVERTAS